MENIQMPTPQPKGMLIKGTMIPAALIGLAVAVVVMFLAYIVPPLTQTISNSFSSFGQMLRTISVIIVLLLYGLVLITPALWFGAKYGWKAAIWVIVFELVWLIILAFLSVLLFHPKPPSGAYINSYPTNCPNCGLYQDQ